MLVHTCRAWWRSKHTKAEQRHLRETEAARGQQQWLLSALGVLPLSPEPGVTGVGLELLETGCSESWWHHGRSCNSSLRSPKAWWDLGKPQHTPGSSLGSLGDSMRQLTWYPKVGLCSNPKGRRWTWVNGHEFEKILGDSEGQRSLACCRPWGHEERTRLSNWVTTRKGRRPA